MDQAITPGRLSLARLSSAELSVVHGFVQTARPRPLLFIALALSWLGNGWIYIVLAVICVAVAGSKALPVLLVSTFSAALLHCVYPFLKRRVARPRPYQRDPSLRSLLPVLDDHSFPSGHAMTLSAALVPLVMAFPQMLGVALIVSLLMGWARMVSAHHYPSDVIAGAGLGVSVAYPISVFALAASPLGF